MGWYREKRIEFVSVTRVAVHATMTSIRIKRLALIAINFSFQCYISQLSLVLNVLRNVLLALRLKVIQIRLINVYTLAYNKKNMIFRKINASVVATQERSRIMMSASHIIA